MFRTHCRAPLPLQWMICGCCMLIYNECWFFICYKWIVIYHNTPSQGPCSSFCSPTSGSTHTPDDRGAPSQLFLPDMVTSRMAPWSATECPTASESAPLPMVTLNMTKIIILFSRRDQSSKGRVPDGSTFFLLCTQLTHRHRWAERSTNPFLSACVAHSY